MGYTDPKRGVGRKVTPEYSSWAHMKSRCHRPNDPDYHNYGGRGIKVCDRWLDFDNFYEDLGPKPSADHTLEREDVNGNYEPNNVVWLEKQLQSRNRRVVQTVVLEGELITLVEASKRLGLEYGTVDSRVRRGWSTDKALHTPIKNSPKRPVLFDYNGELLPLSKIARQAEVSSGNLYYFVNVVGLNIQEAIARA